MSLSIDADGKTMISLLETKRKKNIDYLISWYGLLAFLNKRQLIFFHDLQAELT